MWAQLKTSTESFLLNTLKGPLKRNVKPELSSVSNTIIGTKFNFPEPLEIPTIASTYLLYLNSYRNIFYTSKLPHAAAIMVFQWNLVRFHRPLSLCHLLDTSAPAPTAAAFQSSYRPRQCWLSPPSTDVLGSPLKLPDTISNQNRF